MSRSARGSGGVVQHLWILLLTFVSLTKTTSLKVYDASKSLKDNFFGTCQSNLVKFNGTVDAFLNEPLTHENYLVYRLPISHEELTRYHQIPDIYTWTHYNLSVGLQKGREQAEEWQKPGPMNWAVHAEHPRQNKSNCIAVSKATVERPQKLYHESRQAVTEMYFLRKRNVLIHDTGIVGSRCGYFQLLEACETRFKFIGKRWWNKCKTQLRQAGKTWEDLFDPATSPLFTEEVDANGRVVERSPSGGAKGAARASHVEYVQPFHKRPLVNPVPPIDRYNDTLPWRVIEERNATTAKRPVVQLLPESLSTLCRDQNYISVLTKPWYPHWQYIDGPVLVLTAAWDCNYHHLLLDSLSRIIPILDFIRSSPQMKIHIRRHEIETNSTSYRNAGVALRTRVARFLRIDPQRFISGPVVAKEILIPRAIQCNEPILFPLQMQQLGQTLLQEAEEVMRWELKKAPALQQAYDRTGVYPAQFPFAVHQPLDTSRHVAHDPKRILIQHRSCESNARFDERTDWRCWTQTTFASVVEAMQRTFPASEILSLTNTNASRSHCLACEIAVYRDVDLLVGVHGAGMTNVMFMPPGRSVLLEITGIFDGRMLPVCGYHGPLAAIYGVHHVIHHYDSKADAPLVMEDGARRVKDLFVFLGQQAV